MNGTFAKSWQKDCGTEIVSSLGSTHPAGGAGRALLIVSSTAVIFARSAGVVSR